ncbi:MAG: hypothetical protein MJ095_09840 [Oscillospiraceae bacterium]|nr:hypothetical protein [Oscillospiraceae bacterium]
MKKIEQTPLMKIYTLKFLFRAAVFITVFIVYITRKEMLVDFMTRNFFSFRQYGVNLLHVLWAGFMIMMIRHIFPPEFVTMALKKEKRKEYNENPEYDRLALFQFVKEQNIRAWTVMLVWLSFNAIFAAMYLFHIIGKADLLMLTVFYFLSDYICIIFYCPFQTYIMKNKCCVNCRIYDWGHFMMFTPMLFIKDFFSWSLFFTSLIVLIKWEMIYAKYPERFWSGSNQKLQCRNCKDKTCQIKKKISAAAGRDKKTKQN